MSDESFQTEIFPHPPSPFFKEYKKMIIYDGTPDKEPYKNVFGRVMEAIAKEDADVIYLDADLMNSIGTHKFWKNNRAQAINCGIAEADMVGIAAGLSAAGRKPYIHTFGPFASRRCFDQLFLSVGYAGNSVRVFGSDAGVTAAFNGGTHMPFEDMALLRAVPHSTVIEISDGAMLESLMKQLKDRPGLSYVRLTRKAYDKVYSADHEFSIGKGEILRDGADLTIIACGLMVGEAMKAAAELERSGMKTRVVDMFTVKPLDAALVQKCAKETGAILTAENHNVIGGLGDAVGAAVLESGIPCKFHKHGVHDEFGSVGPQDYLQSHYRLTAAALVEEARRLLHFPA
ncbi:MAG: transketolase family protein [Spirochaetaceae bacterium]|jgi:transketolase|nr:transketolase family protein [Spirochaetaceae bacterium]